MSANDDNGEGLRALFYGLCRFWDINVEKAEDPAGPSDFTLPDFRHRGQDMWFPTYVVILPEPAARQVEIETLLHYGHTALVLDEFDLDEFRLCRHKVHAHEQIRWWIQDGSRTHAAQGRTRLGIGS